MAYGTQLYDPFNSPHAIGNLNFGLQSGANAFCSQTVNNEDLAYFASGYTGTMGFVWYCGKADPLFCYDAFDGKRGLL
jgi:hypothetical protein